MFVHIGCVKTYYLHYIYISYVTWIGGDHILVDYDTLLMVQKIQHVHQFFGKGS